MFARTLPLLAALGALAPATAHAQDTQPHEHVVRPPNPRARTGAILTTVGGSMLMTAPLVVIVAGAGIVSTGGASNYAAMGPVLLGAFAGATIGIGLLVPGIIMLATCKPHDRIVPLPETRQAAWTELRAAPSGVRMVTVPIFAGKF